MRFIVGVLVVVFSSISLASAWSVQSVEDVQSGYISFPQGCELHEGDIVCSGAYAKEGERLSKKLMKLDTLITQFEKAGQRLQANKLRTTIRKAIPMLSGMLARSSSSDRMFQIQYVHAVFKDMNAAVLKKDAAITVVVPTGVTDTQRHDHIRKHVIQQLMARGYANFVKKPFSGNGRLVDTSEEDWEQYEMYAKVMAQDSLDLYIQQQFEDEGLYEIVLYEDEYKHWDPIYLFKDKSDLEDLGYHVVSHRARKNTDAEYRRENISRAFGLVGRLIVLNPGDHISFLNDSLFDPQHQHHYVQGKIIFLDEEVEGYGGGLCGGSTALYQGTVLNKALTIQSRNHSKWYTSLYTATINGEVIKTPGLDSTVYSPGLDLVITNTADYPVVIVSSYDAEHGGIEKVFTLGPIHDRGSLQYIGSYGKSYTIQQKSGEGRAVQGRCYKRNINGVSMKRCYKEIF